MPRRRRPDRGDTLIEVLLALVVIGLSVVALLGGLAASISGSATHKGLSTIDAMLRSYAEDLTDQVELEAAPIYAECPSWTASSYNGTAVNYTAPVGYTIGISSIQYFDRAASQSSSTPWDGACTNPTGLQLVTLSATGPNHTAQTLEVGLRPPGCVYYSTTSSSFVNDCAASGQAVGSDARAGAPSHGDRRRSTSVTP